MVQSPNWPLIFATIRDLNIIRDLTDINQHKVIISNRDFEAPMTLDHSSGAAMAVPVARPGAPQHRNGRQLVADLAARRNSGESPRWSSSHGAYGIHT